MSWISWPFVGLCAVLVLWRGVEAIISTMGTRNALFIVHGTELANHKLQLEKAYEHATASDARLQKLEDDLLNLSQRVPTRLAR